MVLYYIISLLLNVVFSIAFFERINITAMSAIPACLMVVMAFQAFYFKNEKSDVKTAYSSECSYTSSEEKSLMVYLSTMLFIAIPLFMPIAIFFNNVIKVLSVFLYMIALALGGVIYRIKNKDAISARVRSEKKELDEQRKNEELGKFR